MSAEHKAMRYTPHRRSMAFSLLVTVVCESCAVRTPVERTVTEPGDVDVICRGCEASLRATVRDGRTQATRHPMRMSFAGRLLARH